MNSKCLHVRFSLIFVPNGYIFPSLSVLTVLPPQVKQSQVAPCQFLTGATSEMFLILM